MTSYRVSPDTTEIDLDFNRGTDDTIVLEVLDALDQPVGLTSAVATICVPSGGAVLHTWSVAVGNLTIVNNVDVSPAVPSRVRLTVTAAQTAAWWQAWGDAEWQLDVVDNVLSESRRPAQGQVRVRE